MPCANVSRLALLIFFCLAATAWGREYVPVGSVGQSRPAPPLKNRVGPPAPVKARPAPPLPVNPRQEPIRTQPVQIPKSLTPADSSPATPEVPTSQAPASDVNLFGTIEFRHPAESLPGWQDVLSRNSKEPIFIPEKYFNKNTTWQALRARAAPLPLMEKLRLVNEFWNAWPYREDIANWGKPDYWAIPAQFLTRSGDCEDYAIAKYFTLKALGVDPASMRIVVLRDTIRNLAHAVLAVYLDDNIFILDNLSNVVLPHKRLRNYSPQFSINEEGRWIHIKGKTVK